jgi:hypothetical protein
MSTESFVNISIGTVFIVAGFFTYKKKRAVQMAEYHPHRLHKNPLRTKLARLPLGLLTIIFIIIGLYSFAGPLLTPHIGSDFWVLFTLIFIASFLVLLQYVLK